MTYVAAGIRGNLTLWKELLSRIRFGKKDFLFVIGDFLGESEENFDLLEELSFAENIWPVASAKDRLTFEMLSGFDRMLKEGGTPDAAYVEKMKKWAAEGGMAVLDAFRALDSERKEGILDYLAEMPPVEKVTVGKQDYLLMHAGLTGFDGTDPTEAEDEAFFGDAPVREFDGYVTVIGGNDGSREVRKSGSVIFPDCGCGLGGRLCALRLEDGQEYYVG